MLVICSNCVPVVVKAVTQCNKIVVLVVVVRSLLLPVSDVRAIYFFVNL